MYACTVFFRYACHFDSFIAFALDSQPFVVMPLHLFNLVFCLSSPFLWHFMTLWLVGGYRIPCIQLTYTIIINTHMHSCLLTHTHIYLYQKACYSHVVIHNGFLFAWNVYELILADPFFHAINEVRSWRQSMTTSGCKSIYGINGILQA